MQFSHLVWSLYNDDVDHDHDDHDLDHDDVDVDSPPSPIGRRKSLDAVLTSRYDMISSPVGVSSPVTFFAHPPY